MNEKRIEWKVGVFVLAGILLIAALLLNFSKGTRLFRKTYGVNLWVPSVGGLRESSAVFLSGVQVGQVKHIKLAEDGRSAVIRLQLRDGFPIYKDAEFVIEQMGLLGDQFVTIHPKQNKGPILQDGDEVSGVEPFNLQEVARSATDLMKRFDNLSAELKDAVNRLNHQLFDSNTLANASATVANVRTASERARTMIERADGLIAGNVQPVNTSVSNLVAFTEQLRSATARLEETIVTNRNEITAATKNLEVASASLKNLVTGADAGQGTIGALFRDEPLRQRLTATINNAEALSGNLVVLSSNLNRYGLFYKPLPPRTPAETKQLEFYPGKSPFKP